MVTYVLVSLVGVSVLVRKLTETFTVKLLNQLRDSGHQSVVVSKFNDKVGFPHVKLSKFDLAYQFLKDDCMFIEVLKSKLFSY